MYYYYLVYTEILDWTQGFPMWNNRKYFEGQVTFSVCSFSSYYYVMSSTIMSPIVFCSVVCRSSPFPIPRRSPLPVQFPQTTFIVYSTQNSTCSQTVSLRPHFPLYSVRSLSFIVHVFNIRTFLHQVRSFTLFKSDRHRVPHRFMSLYYDRYIRLSSGTVKW